MNDNRISVGQMIKALEQFDRETTIIIDLRGGGGVTIERRDLCDKLTQKTEEIVAIFASNGGRFGFNPLTEEEYKTKSEQFLQGLKHKNFTTTHGDYRIYNKLGLPNDSCYGTVYDSRIINRMVEEGILEKYSQPFSIDGVRLV
jgi:hypothetical protein